MWPQLIPRFRTAFSSWLERFSAKHSIYVRFRLFCCQVGCNRFFTFQCYQYCLFRAVFFCCAERIVRRKLPNEWTTKLNGKPCCGSVYCQRNTYFPLLGCQCALSCHSKAIQLHMFSVLLFVCFIFSLLPIILPRPQYTLMNVDIKFNLKPRMKSP